MKKMKTVFETERVNGELKITSKVRDGYEWVVNGEGVATIKFDGTACMVRDGKLFLRRDRKILKEYKKLLGGEHILKEHMFKSAPEGWEACEPEPDKFTGHWPGWLPVSDHPQDKWHVLAFNSLEKPLEDGTYELVGPAFSNNPYNLDHHEFCKHGSKIVDIKTDFESIKKWLAENKEEGLVFHHHDGRMAKIRRKDFFNIDKKSWSMVDKF